MPASPTSKRAIPTQNFDDYTLIYDVGPQFGLYPIPTEKMEIAPLSAAGSFAYPASIPIGFNFPFCGTNYTSVTMHYNGFCILDDGAGSAMSNWSTNSGVWWAENTSTDWNGYGTNTSLTIKDTFTLANSKTVLLCPWWSSIFNTYRTIEEASLVINYRIPGRYNDLVAGKVAPNSLGVEIYGKEYGPQRSQLVYTPRGKARVFRWNSTMGDSTYVIRFDVVLYEDGTIEYRYSPLPRNGLTHPSGAVATKLWATTGIFTNNLVYRDFMPEVIGFDSRGRHPNGGASYKTGFQSLAADDGVYQKYTVVNTYSTGTTGTPVVNSQAWPGGFNFGARFTFSPPRNRRWVNKTTIRNRGGVDFISRIGGSLFDDNRTVNYTPQLVEFPSMLPVDYRLDANTINNEATLRLYRSGSIQAVVTASGLFDDVLIDSTSEAERRASSGDAFNEERLFEIGRNTDSFFATGSSTYIGQEPGVFSQPLSEKTQIRMSFPVNRPVKMMTNSSSIYYFNRGLAQWNIPTSSVNDHVGPFDKYRWYAGVGGGSSSPSYYIEDQKAFNAFGIPIFSGSRSTRFSTLEVPNEDRNNFGSEKFIYSQLGESGAKESELTDFCSRDYYNSAQRDQKYSASLDETFQLQVDYPFLIESIVVEMPFSAGQGWFRDKTCFRRSKLYTPTGGYAIGDPIQDGGPILTLGLFSQKNYGTSSIRDLIASEIITHNNDYGVTDINFYDSAAYGYTRGLGKNFEMSTSPTVVSSSNYNYSGSIVVKMKPEISNGLHLFLRTQYPRTMGLETYTDFLSREFIPFKGLTIGTSSFENRLFILGVDPFGRGMTGFSPSGGSIFGREHTFQDPNAKIQLKNRFYTTDPTEISESYVRLRNARVGAPFAFPYLDSYCYLGTKNESPYLINPGENLVLSLSKTRPVTSIFTGSATPYDASNYTGLGTMTSSSYDSYLADPLGHDVTLSTGSINITFYGSYVQGNRGYNP